MNPSGMSKLFRICKAVSSISAPVATGRRLATKAAARTNRDGELESPGSPFMPGPGPMGPIAAHADRIGEARQLAVAPLDDGGLSRRVVQDQVRRGSEAERPEDVRP